MAMKHCHLYRRRSGDRKAYTPRKREAGTAGFLNCNPSMTSLKIWNMWLPTIGSRIKQLGIKSRKSMAKRAWAVVMGTFGELYLGAMTTDLENSCCI